MMPLGYDFHITVLCCLTLDYIKTIIYSRAGLKQRDGSTWPITESLCPFFIAGVLDYIRHTFK